MNKKTIIGLIFGGVVITALIVGGMTGFFGFLGFGSEKAPKFLPEDTSVYLAVNLTAQDQKGFMHLKEVFEDIDQLEDAFDDFMDELEDEFNLTFEDDIKPWIGSEIAVGLIGDIATSYDIPRIVIVAQSRNDKNAQDFIEELVDILEDNDLESDDESYKDVDYIHFEGDYPEETISLGLIKGYFVFAIGEESMEDVIDARIGRKDSLADDPRFMNISSTLPKQAATYIVVDYKKMGLDDLLAEELSYEIGYDSVEALLKITEDLAFGCSLDLTDEGIQLDYVSMLDPDELPDAMREYLDRKPSRQRILSKVPEDTLAFVSGGDLAGVWEMMIGILKEEIPDLSYQLSDFSEAFGMRLDEDTLSWAAGEYALVVVDADALDGMLPVGGYFIQEVSDQNDAEDFIDDVIELTMNSLFYELDFNGKDFGDTEIQMMGEEIFGEDIFGYGFTRENELILGITEDALENLLEDHPNSISRNKYFKIVQKHLPRDNMGYLYINIEGVIRQAYMFMDDYDREYFNEYVQPLFEPIKAIGAANSGLDLNNGISHGVLYIYIP